MDRSDDELTVSQSVLWVNESSCLCEILWISVFLDLRSSRVVDRGLLDYKTAASVDYN